MKTRNDLLKSLENLFLASQNKITDIPDGSVIKAILYSVASSLEEAYKNVEDVLGNLYINSAEGEYLDKLIEGFVGLKRLEAKRSIGYVLLELGEPITDANLDKLIFSFSEYDPKTDYLNTNIPGTVVVPISPEPGTTINVTIIPPHSIKTTENDYLIDQTTGLQNLFAQFRDLILRTYTTTGLPVRYVILPVATVETGAYTSLDIGEIDTFINLGIPVNIVNLYVRKNAELDKYSIVDPDGIAQYEASPYSDSFMLGYMAEISGGTDKETDEAYRKRFYDYLNSLSKGTSKAIEFGISNNFPDIQVSAIQTNKKGEVDIILYLTRPVAPNLTEQLHTVLEDFRPVGIKLNIFTTNLIPVSVLLDAKGTSITQVTEKARVTLKDIIQAKGLGEQLVYTDIHEGLDVQEIEYIDNVFYGLYLTKQLFDTYSTTLLTAYGQLIYAPIATYADVYQQIVDYPENVRLFDASRAYNGYPLVEFVRTAKQVPDPTALNPHLADVVSTIQSCPAGVLDIDCLNTLAPSHPTLYITIKDVADLLGEEVAQYYKIKLLTLPNILHLPGTVAEPLIEKVIVNDVILLTHRDIRPALLNGLEKLILANDNALNNKVFKSSYLVGVRPYVSN